MINEFRRFISDNNLISPSDRILLAVSGGIDSMVMAHLFHVLNYEIGIAHCNFGLRAGDSDKDEELVRKFSEKNNIPFYAVKFETKAYAKRQRLSVQMAARELRYNWFEEVRMNNGFDSIAVAHNLNDNIETMLINLIRGTGLAGMSGMKPLNNKIIRPLLFATRDDISLFSDQKNIVFREDKSNADTKYIRNKIRHNILPVLKEINPSIETTLNETAERFLGFNEIVADYMNRLREDIAEELEQFVKFDILLLKKHSGNKAVLFELFKPYGITGALLNDLIKVIEGNTGGQVITETHRIIKNRKELIVSDEKFRNETSYTFQNAEEICTFPGISTVKVIKIASDFEIPSDAHIACIDSKKILFPLTIRRWRAGDYFYPLGMNQKKKLSDYFIDNKYSIFDKENIFILESNGKIVWIIGDRIDDRFKITRSTSTAILIKSKKKALKIKPIR